MIQHYILDNASGAYARSMLTAIYYRRVSDSDAQNHKNNILLA